VIDQILCGDALTELKKMPDESVQCCVTSPPYFGLRNYQVDGQIGMEHTIDEYVEKLVEVFREVNRVLRADGVLFLNLGDSYCSTAPGTMGDKLNQRGVLKGVSNRRAEGSRKYRPETPKGLKPKDLIGVPWRVAFALQADGWYLRSAIPWLKRNCMPESTKDRPVTAIEYVFLLSKSAKYFYDAESVKMPGKDWGTRDRKDGSAFVNGTPGRSKQSGGKNCDFSGGRSWRNSDLFFQSWQGLLINEEDDPLAFIVNTHSYKEAHFAVMPEKLVEPCIKAGTSETGCCPKCGAGWKRVIEQTGHINNREPAHQPGNTPTKVDSTGWAPTTRATDQWQPSCSCGLDPVPCVVLDPFGGAGTVGLVARRLNRHFTLIDLKFEYCMMASRRIYSDKEELLRNNI
jgi:DNA modification methylase